jgi:hypothetical protein
VHQHPAQDQWHRLRTGRRSLQVRAASLPFARHFQPLCADTRRRSWENAARRIAAASKGACKIVVESSTIPVQTGETMRKVLDAVSPGAFEVLSIPSFYRGGSALKILESPEVLLPPPFPPA